MKKKLSLISAILTVVAIASLTACSGNSQPAQSDGSSQSTFESSTAGSSDNSETSYEDNSSQDSSTDNTSSDNSSTDNTSSDNSSTDDTSSDNSSTDDTSSDSSSIDDTSSDNSPTDDTSSDNSSNDNASNDTEPVAPSQKGDVIAKAAYDMLDKPFTDGGYKPETGFDNSGLIYYALTNAGLECPRGLTAQKDMGKEVQLSDLQKGDIVFIKDGDSFFGGIYTGDDTMVFSPYPGQTVRTANLKSIYYIDNFLKAVRVG
ncbi:MAG: C40 family peptidase [Ruminiclostridium sp.]|nr:C40 family peptidase [Ruminiclostridium sp.]